MSASLNGSKPESSLRLALDILELVARNERGLTAADIARTVGSSRASVYRAVNSLVQDEYLVRRADFSGFMLGARILELAAVVGTHRRPAYAEIVSELRRSTGETVHLFGFHSAGVMVLDEDRERPLTDPGTLLHDPRRSALGHLWLVAHPERSLPHAPQWGVRPGRDDVAAISEAYRVRGYAELAAQLSPEHGCLAVPIIDARQRPVGAIALSTTVARLSLAARHVTALRAAASPIAASDALSGW